MADYFNLANWLELGDSGGVDLGSLKQAVFKRGVNSRGWRLYVDHGDVLFSPLREPWLDQSNKYSPAEVATSWLRLLQSCEMDVLPPPELVASMAQWKVPGNQLDAVPPLFLRAAWKSSAAAQYSDDGIDGFIEAELIPLAQWFFGSKAYKATDTGRLKAGWESLKRLRRESVAMEARKLGPDEWPPILRKFESGAYRMLALTSETELVEEGQKMNHCVGSYGDRCRFEPLRIFSVQYKKTGARVATLSIRENKPGSWVFDQLKGPANSDVDPSIWREADALLRIANRISRNDTQVRTFLDFIHSLAAK